MKKIGFLAFDQHYGLTYHFVDWVLSIDKACANKFEIYIFTVRTKDNYKLFDKLTNLSNVKLIILDDAKQLINHNLLMELDLVHCHGYRHIFSVLKTSRSGNSRPKIVITMHSFRHGKKSKIFYANTISSLFSHRISMYHFLSWAAFDEFYKFNIVKSIIDKTCVFPLGCDANEFRVDDDSINIIAKNLGIDRAKINIVYLGNFIQRKQQKWLILNSKRPLIDYNAVLWLLGDGPQKIDLHKMVSTLGLSQHVKIVNRIDRDLVPAFLNNMDFAVCTSKSETFGHLIIEPMFANLPVISFPIGIARETVKDYFTGNIVTKKTFEITLKHYINNPQNTKHMGLLAGEFVHQVYTWDIVAKSTLNMYERVINEN